jgi:hypothetical protein
LLTAGASAEGGEFFGMAQASRQRRHVKQRDAAAPDVFDAATYRRTERAMHELATTFNCSFARTGTVCTGDDPCNCHGDCQVGVGCTCDSDSTRGFWTGVDCKQCKRGYATADCTLSCMGGACNSCNGHGVCNQGVSGDGSCTCWGSDSSGGGQGSWSGSSCGDCAKNYFGITCQQACPGVEQDAAACFGRGDCISGVNGTGLCLCQGGWGSATGCLECDAGHWGAGCLNECDGYTAGGLPCSGHGKCFNGTKANGTCVCTPGSDYGTFDCSVQCPNDCSGVNHGVCLAGAQNNATCQCLNARFAQPDCADCNAAWTNVNDGCNIECLTNVLDQHVCSNRGTCLWSVALQAALCTCEPGYAGTTCSDACPGNTPCSGHGTCANNAALACNCFNDAVNGFWEGETCETCQVRYNQSYDCTNLCPSTAANGVCNGHGTCIDGRCHCDRGTVSGGDDYCGLSCEWFSRPGQRDSGGQLTGCAQYICRTRNMYGPTCQQACPGIIVSGEACNNHGFCSDDARDSDYGSCTCVFGFSGTGCQLQCPTNGTAVCSGSMRGNCSSINNVATCACRPQFIGTTCEHDCPTANGAVCGGHGTCQLTGGTPVCKCAAGWTGKLCNIVCHCESAHGDCNHAVCADYTVARTCTDCICHANFTGLCDTCVTGSQGANCDGACVQGYTAGKACVCDAHWSTPACNVQCEIFNSSVCSGNGVCDSGATRSGLCSCFDAAGQLSGAPVFFGKNCSQPCTAAHCKTHLLLRNPQCNVSTGACECQDNSRGHWAGAECAICAHGFWGPSCTDLCECSNHGSCDADTGICACFADAVLGHYSGQNCKQCAAEFIGEKCTRQNVLITRVLRFNTSDAKLLPPPGSSVLPQPTLLSLDPALHTLLAGGTPVLRFNVSDATMGPLQTSVANGTAACTQEAFHAWPHGFLTYYLMQPRLAVTGGAGCAALPARVLKDSRNSTTIDFGAMEQVWEVDAGRGVNNTMRVIAASSRGSESLDIATAKPGVAFLLAQLADGVTGTQWPGGYVFFVSVESVGTPAQPKRQPLLNVHSETPQFAINDVALIARNVEQLPDVVVGGRNNGNAELYYVRPSMSTESFIKKYNNRYSIMNKLHCWPTLGSSGQFTPTCVGCESVDKVTAFGANIVAAIRVRSGATSQTMVAWLQRGGHILPEQRFGMLVAGACQPRVGAAFRLEGDIAVAASYTDEVGSVATSMAVDNDGQIAFVCLSLQTEAIMAKFSLDGNFSIYGKLPNKLVTSSGSIPKPEVFSALTVDSGARLLYGLVTGVPFPRIVTFVLYEIHTVTPDIADHRGATEVVIHGVGFRQIRDYPIVCQFGKKAIDVVPARILDLDPVTNVARRLSCNVTALTDVSSSSTQCEGQLVEVSLYGADRDFLFTRNHVTIKRIQTAMISAVSPDRGGEEGNDRVNITGQRFLNTSVALCKFFSTAPDSPDVLTASMIFLSPTRAHCRQPPVVAGSAFAEYDASWLDIALDGQIFTGRPIQYQIVGTAYNLSSVANVNATAEEVTVISIAVSVVDSKGHELGLLDNVPRLVTLQGNVTDETTIAASSYSWRQPTDGYPWPYDRQNVLNFSRGVATLARRQEMTSRGTALYGDILFYKPRTGSMRLSFVYDGAPRAWTAFTTVEILVGAMHALALSNSKEVSLGRFAQSAELAPPPEIIVVDRLGNIVPSWEGVVVEAHTFYVMDSRKSVEVNYKTYTVQQLDLNSVRLRIHVYLKERHGADHYIRFTSTGLLPTTSPALRTARCADYTREYKTVVSDEQSKAGDVCAPCDRAGAICDGHEIIQMKAGYWRAANATIQIYKCPAGPSVCLGSTKGTGYECAEGYGGPLCSLCSKGYGHSGPKACAKCPSVQEQVILVVLAVVFALTVILVWTTVTLRAVELTDLSVILRTVVNHMQATGKLGEFSTQWDPFLKGVFAVQDSASTMSFSGLSSLDCLLKETGNNYETIFGIYMMLPLVSIVMALGVFITVRVFKLKPVISKELEAEIKLDIKNNVNPRTAILLTRYPLYMVATTTFCVNFFAMYQVLITQATTVLRCESFQTSATEVKEYLAVDMSIECTNGDHSFRTAAMVCAIMYGLGIPALFMCGYWTMMGRVDKPALTQMIFMFLIGGYKDTFWFWQAIIMIRKLVLVLIIVFIGDNPQLQSYCGMWAMSIALVIQIWFEPNSKPEFNLVEGLSLAIITVTLNLGLLYFWPDIGSAGATVLTGVLVLITIGATLMFLYFLYDPLKETIHLKIDELREVVVGVKQKLAKIGEHDDDEEDKKTFQSKQRVVYEEEDDDVEDEAPGVTGTLAQLDQKRRQKKQRAGLAPAFEDREEEMMAMSAPPPRAPRTDRPDPNLLPEEYNML